MLAFARLVLALAEAVPGDTSAALEFSCYGSRRKGSKMYSSEGLSVPAVVALMVLTGCGEPESSVEFDPVLSASTDQAAMSTSTTGAAPDSGAALATSASATTGASPGVTGQVAGAGGVSNATLSTASVTSTVSSTTTGTGASGTGEAATTGSLTAGTSDLSSATATGGPSTVGIPTSDGTTSTTGGVEGSGGGSTDSGTSGADNDPACPPQAPSAGSLCFAFGAGLSCSYGDVTCTCSGLPGLRSWSRTPDDVASPFGGQPFGGSNGGVGFGSSGG